MEEFARTLLMVVVGLIGAFIAYQVGFDKGWAAQMERRRKLDRGESVDTVPPCPPPREDSRNRP